MTTETEPAPDANFEEALRRLEAIVDDLERGEPSLSTALAKYEQGVGLLARCQRVLEQAERSVALLAGVDGEGNAVTRPFEESAPPLPDAPAPPAATPRPRARKTARTDNEPFIPF